MRYVDTSEYVGALRDLALQGEEVSMLISGNSMAPFLIHQRDTIFFTRPDSALRRGDMVFFQRSSGQYVMHRIWKVKPDGIYVVGDAQMVIEGPLQKEQIFARVTRVRRKDKMMTKGDFWWEFFEKVWIRMVPLRPLAMKVFGWIKPTKAQ